MTETWDIRDLSDIRSPAVAAALAYWRGKVTDVAGALPARAAIDPVEMRGFLTKILIVDIARSGTAPENFAFIYRLCGSDITDNNGENLTGMEHDAVVGRISSNPTQVDLRVVGDYQSYLARQQGSIQQPLQKTPSTGGDEVGIDLRIPDKGKFFFI